MTGDTASNADYLPESRSDAATSLVDSTCDGAPVTYIDCRNEIWTEVPKTRGMFVEIDGERFTFAWADDHFGPLRPAS